MDWSSVPWIDLAFIAMATWYMWTGYRRGFIVATFDALGFFSGFAASLLFYAPVAARISSSFGMPRPFAKPLAFFGLLIATEYVTGKIAMFAYRRVPLRIRVARINRYLGIVPGFLDAAFTAAIMLSLVLALPMPQGVKKQIQMSPTGGAAIRVSGALDAAFTGIFGGVIKETLTFVTIRPDSDKTVDLQFRTDGFAPDAAGEAAMLELVNAERAERGIRRLVADPALTGLARAHSADMLSRGYFSHVNPEGMTPSARADAAGFSYLVYGENLALAPDVPLAHQGLMDSPGHRANILSPDFGRIGIGIQDAGVYGIMVTQNFAN